MKTSSAKTSSITWVAINPPQDKAQERDAEPRRFASMKSSTWLPTLVLGECDGVEAGPAEVEKVDQSSHETSGQLLVATGPPELQEEKHEHGEQENQIQDLENEKNEALQPETGADLGKQEEDKKGEAAGQADETMQPLEAKEELKDEKEDAPDASKDGEGEVKNPQDKVEEDVNTQIQEQKTVKAAGKTAKQKAQRRNGKKKTKTGESRADSTTQDEKKKKQEVQLEKSIQRPGFLDEVSPVAPENQAKGEKKKKGKRAKDQEDEEGIQENPKVRKSKKDKKSWIKERKTASGRFRGKKAAVKAKESKEKVEKKGSKSKKAEKEVAEPKRKAKATDAKKKKAKVEKTPPGRRKSNEGRSEEEIQKRQRVSRKSSAYHVAFRKAKLAGKTEEECKVEAKQAPKKWG